MYLFLESRIVAIPCGTGEAQVAVHTWMPSYYTVDVSNNSSLPFPFIFFSPAISFFFSLSFLSFLFYSLFA